MSFRAGKIFRSAALLVVIALLTTMAAAQQTVAASKPAPAAPTAPAARKTREGSKQARLVEMLKRPDGVTVAEAATALDWQHHTVRGALAGALKKKLGLTIESEKVEGRGRVYRLA